jgi:hypothetical protein
MPCYVYADCPPSVPLKVTATRRYSARSAHLRILVAATVSGVTLPVPDATVRVGGRSLDTNDDGVATTTLALGKPRTVRLTASDREYFDGRAAVRLRWR